MIEFLPYFLLVPLSIIIYQDYKYRHIHLINLIILLVLTIASLCHYQDKEAMMSNIFINLLYITGVLSILSIIESIKQRRIYKIIDTKIGKGDVLYLYIVSLLFCPILFIMYVVASTVFQLTITAISRIIGLRHDKHLPFAGTASIVLIVAILLNKFWLNLDWQNSDSVFLLLFSE